MDATSLFQFLSRHGIHYTMHEHPPVFTSEQARRLISPLPGLSAKNLFLRDKKGSRYFLLVLPDTKTLNLNSLAASLNLTRLSLASADRLMSVLGVAPGAVSLLALVNDPACQVVVLIDDDLWQADFLQCHPLVNTATLVIALADIKKFLQIVGSKITLIKGNSFN